MDFSFFDTQNTDEKLIILRNLTNVILEDQCGSPPCFLIYIQDRIRLDLRYWARQSFDRDELVNDMLYHYYKLVMKYCNVS